jgi:hypothetical protein
MKDDHEQHDHSGHHPPSHHRPEADREPAVKPGYPEHPEEAYPPGALPGTATDERPSGGQGAAHAAHPGAAAEGHGAHGHHSEHGAHEGHDKHAGHSVETFRNKFWLSLMLTIPTCPPARWSWRSTPSSCGELRCSFRFLHSKPQPGMENSPADRCKNRCRKWYSIRVPCRGRS